MQAQAVYVAVIMPYSVFPMVSAVIFQTVSYDRRLGQAYLKTDYSVEESDPEHQFYIAYAAVMGVVYMVGIPMLSYFLVRAWRDPIMKIQQTECDIELCGVRNESNKEVLFRKRDEMLKQNPFLQGLSPLYRDYQPEFIFGKFQGSSARSLCADL